MVVEDELLGVSEARGVELEVRAVRLTAEDRAGVGEVEVLALFGREVHAAVTDGEVEPAVRAEAQAVEVMPAQGDVDAVAR